jgi:hypothetical protein
LLNSGESHRCSLLRTVIPNAWARATSPSGMEKQKSTGFKPKGFRATPRVICLITWPLPDSNVASHTNNMVDDCLVTAAREGFLQRSLDLHLSILDVLANL